MYACVHVQSCPNLCDPMDYSLPGSSVHGIFQVRILQWVAISSSRGSSQSRDQNCVSCIADALPLSQQGSPIDTNILRWLFLKRDKWDLIRLNSFPGNSLAVQWLGLHTSSAGDMGSILGLGIKIPQAKQCGKKKKKNSFQGHTDRRPYTLISNCAPCP